MYHSNNLPRRYRQIGWYHTIFDAIRGPTPAIRLHHRPPVSLWLRNPNKVTVISFFLSHFTLWEKTTNRDSAKMEAWEKIECYDCLVVHRKFTCELVMRQRTNNPTRNHKNRSSEMLALNNISLNLNWTTYYFSSLACAQRLFDRSYNIVSLHGLRPVSVLK